MDHGPLCTRLGTFRVPRTYGTQLSASTIICSTEQLSTSTIAQSEQLLTVVTYLYQCQERLENIPFSLAGTIEGLAGSEMLSMEW
jgi:hypothetical protein